MLYEVMPRKKILSELFTRLKILRKAWGLSQKNMAIRVDIAVSTYQYYERGERDVPSEVLYKLITYGVKPDWLLTGEGEMIRKDKKKPPKVEKSGIDMAAPGTGYNADSSFKKAAYGLKEIFDSGDSVLIPAVLAGVHAFQISVRRKAQIDEQTNEINNLRKECDALKKRFNSIEKRIMAVDRRKHRRQEDTDAPEGVERRSGLDRRKYAVGE